MNDRDYQLANQERKRTNWLKTKVRKFAIWLTATWNFIKGFVQETIGDVQKDE